MRWSTANSRRKRKLKAKPKMTFNWTGPFTYEPPSGYEPLG